MGVGFTLSDRLESLDSSKEINQNVFYQNRQERQETYYFIKVIQWISPINKDSSGWSLYLMLVFILDNPSSPCSLTNFVKQKLNLASWKINLGFNVAV